tara:strand:+ start:11928 stop:12155 length:228 start_codon:yes stop_codon:yes gene_type:complete
MINKASVLRRAHLNLRGLGLKKLMIEAGIEPFNFHDLKAAGVSDTTGDKLKASGHHDAKIFKVYDRKENKVKPTR